MGDLPEIVAEFPLEGQASSALAAWRKANGAENCHLSVFLFRSPKDRKDPPMEGWKNLYSKGRVLKIASF